MNEPTMETLVRRLRGVAQENCRLKRMGALVLTGIIAWGALLTEPPISALAANKINLLRLEKSGSVTEINPRTHVIFNSLNDYLVSRFRGKVVEVEIEECRDQGLAVILIRYEEAE